MQRKTIVSKVAGVTYEGRQSIIARLQGDEPCRIVPEPADPHDPNAVAVHVATADGVKHIGYVPRDLAKEIAPWLEGEAVMVRILEIVGGFETFEGDIASYGLRIEIEIPTEQSI